MPWDALHEEIAVEFERVPLRFDYEERPQSLLYERVNTGICPICLKPFRYPKKGPKKRTCSPKCNHKAWRLRCGIGLRVTKGCLWCGLNLADRHSNAVFCSRKCRRKFKSKLKSSKKPIRLPGYCRLCGGDILNRRSTRYCSAQCRKRAEFDKRKARRAELLNYRHS